MQSTAQAAVNYATKLAELPFVVGYHWWGWADDSEEGRFPDLENSNYGLVHIDDDNYDELVDQFTALNGRLESIHNHSYPSRYYKH